MIKMQTAHPYKWPTGDSEQAKAKPVLSAHWQVEKEEISWGATVAELHIV